MSPQQQLLERATAPGDSYWYRGECIRRPYAPVNVCKDDWTFDYAMSQPDTPDIAAQRAANVNFAAGVEIKVAA